MPTPVLTAAERGFSFAELYPIGLIFCAIAIFAAIGALSHQHERAFSASIIYLGLCSGPCPSIARSIRQVAYPASPTAVAIRRLLPNGCWAISRSAPCWLVVLPPASPSASFSARAPTIA